MKKYGLIITLVVVLSCAIGKYNQTKAPFSLIYAENNEISEMANALVTALNKENVPLQDKYDVYVTNFDTSDIPNIQNKARKNILYLGSRNGFDIEKVKDFDYIFTSTPDLREFFNLNNIKSELLPPFLAEYSKKTSKCVENPNQKPCYYIVVGASEQIQTLQENNVSLKQYDILTPDIINNIMNDAENISGLIMYNVYHSDNSLDYSPLILKAMSAKIPVITDNKALQYYTQNIIVNNDIPAILQNKKKIAKIANRAYNFLKLLTPKATARRILADITGNKDYPLLKNSIAINGNTRLVDTFMNTDLQDGLEHNDIENVQIYHVDSNITDVSDIDIYMRGSLPVNKNHPKTKKTLSIIYLYYPAVDDWDINHPSMETYIQRMLPELKKFDVVTVASENLARKLSEHQIKTRYIPQYTNPRRFYPEYHEELKTEVLIVGAKTPYRRSVSICLKHNIPISLYGPYWPDNMALKDYIDNNELHKYYTSAKIVLSDQRGEMTEYGFIANRIYDVTASGGFVISEYIPEVEKIYGDSIPMWKTEEELITLINYYLDPAHEAERQQKIETARQITLENFTVDKIGEKFKKIIFENHKKI